MRRALWVGGGEGRRAGQRPTPGLEKRQGRGSRAVWAGIFARGSWRRPRRHATDGEDAKNDGTQAMELGALSFSFPGGQSQAGNWAGRGQEGSASANVAGLCYNAAACTAG
ncbi:MAG: hypothetical protein MZV70_69210 [Desulfobacterales bacterium]|nr:hypothetical protein [Desulfobacterales bacterium]